MGRSEILAREAASQWLEVLVGTQVTYALKSPDTELYDLGFGRWSLHALCPWKWILPGAVRRFEEDLDAETFARDAKLLTGQTVRRVALSGKHDLWLDLGESSLVFVTWEDGEESWRLLQDEKGFPHLVAADCWIRQDSPDEKEMSTGG